MKYQIKPLGTPWRIDDLKATLERNHSIFRLDISY